MSRTTKEIDVIIKRKLDVITCDFCGKEWAVSRRDIADPEVPEVEFLQIIKHSSNDSIAWDDMLQGEFCSLTCLQSWTYRITGWQ